MKNKSFKDVRSFSRNPIAAAALILLTGHAQAGTDLPVLGNHDLPNGITLDNSTAGALHITQQAVGQSGKPANSQIDWDSFSVGENMHVYFDQPNASSVILNRVVGADASTILGNIKANGRIFLINPNGITFGVNSQVNVGSLVASTLKLDEGETKNDLSKIVLNGQAKDSTGLVQQGAINANQIALIGATVTNTGNLNASAGVEGQQPKVYLIAAQKVTADTTGDYIVLTPAAGAEHALLQSLSSIDAGNGTITLIAKSDGTGGASVLNLQGIMKAGSLHTSDSGITLQADQIQQTAVGDQAVNPLKTTGSLDIQAKQVDLSRADNQISGAVSMVSGGDAKLNSSSGLTVDRVQATGAVDLQSGADIHVNGNVTAGSDLSLSASKDVVQQSDTSIKVDGKTQVSGASVDLSATGNDFKGALALTSGNANIHDQNDLVLGDVTSQGDLTLSAAGGLSQAQSTAVSAQGVSNVTAKSVDLTQANNDFGGVLSATATNGSVSVVAKNNVVLGKTDSTKDLTVTAGGQLSQVEGTSATVGGATTVQAQSVALDQAGNDFTGAVTATSDEGKLSIADKSDLVLSSVSSKDDLTLNAEGGLSQVAGTAVSAQAAGNVTAKSVDLTQANNDFGGVLSATATNGSVNIVAKNDLVLGKTDSTKDLTVTAGGQLTEAQGAAVSVHGATAAQAGSVVLDQAGNDFSGALSATSKAGSIVIADKNDLILGNTVSAGGFTVTAGGQLGQGEGTAATVGGATTAKAQSVVLDQTGNDFKGALAVASSVGAARIHDQNNLVLGDITSKGDLNLSAEGDLTQVAGTAVSAQGASNVTAKSVDLSQANNDFGGVLSVTSTAGNIGIADKDDLALGNTSSVGSLTVTAGEQLTEAQGAAVTVNGTSTVQAKSVVLNQAGNDFIGALNATSKEGMLSIADKSDLVLGNVSSKGDLTLSAKGELSQVADTAVAAQAASNVTAKSVNLTQTNNDFSGVLSTTSTAGNIGIADKNTLALGNTDSAGGLTLTVGTQLTQAQGSAVSVVGATTVQAQSIALDQAGNDFKGLVSTTAGNTSVVDKNDLVFGAVNSDGDLSITVGGQLGQAKNAAMAVAGTTTAQAQSVVLDQAGNDFKGALTATSSNGVTRIQDQNDLLLGNITSKGDLTLSAKGELTQVEGTAVSAHAASDLTAQSVNLTQGNNDFMGAVAVKSMKGNIGVVDKNDLVLGNVNGANDLNLNAKGELSQVADTAVSAHGASNVTAQSVNLTQINNDFVGTVVVKSTTGGISVVDKNDLTLGNTDSAQDLNVTAEGQLTQAQGTAVTVDGAASVQAQSVALEQASNDFKGTLAATSTTGNTSVVDKNDLVLGNVSSAAGLSLNVDGQLLQQQGASAHVAGETHLQAAAVSLNQANNQWSGAVYSSTNGGGTDLAAKGDLALGNVNSSGALNLSATGNLTQLNNTAVNVTQGGVINAKSVDLRQAGNDFQGAVSLNSNGGDVAVFDKNDFTFDSGQTKGNLSVQALGQLTQTGGTSVKVSGNSSLNGRGVALGESNNDFGDAVSASAGSGDVALGDSNDLVIGSGYVAGNLQVHAAGQVTQANGAAMSVNGIADLTGKSVSLDQADNHFSGRVSATSSEGQIRLSDNGNLNVGDVHSASGLLLHAKGDLTQVDQTNLVASGSTDLQAKSIDLQQLGNEFSGAVSVSTTDGNATLFNKSDLQLNSGSVQGVLNVRAEGAISQKSGGAIAVAEQTVVQAKSVSVDQLGNDFKGVVSVVGTPNAVALGDKNDLSLGAVNTSGDLTVKALGQVSQAASTALSVQGETTVSGGSVTLNQADNKLVGAVSASSTEGAIVINNSDSLKFGAVSSAGDLNISAQGELSQVAGTAVTVRGASHVAAQSINLTEASNDLGGALSATTSAGSVSVVDQNDLALDNTSSAGDLNIVAGGKLTEAQGAAVTVDGTTAVQAQSIQLDQAGNDFKGVLTSTSTAGNTSITDKNGLTLGNTSSAADLNLSAQGELSQVAGTAISAKGSSHVVAQSINLTQANNDFDGVLSVTSTAGSTSVVDKSDLVLGNTSSAGELNVIAGGQLSEAQNAVTTTQGVTKLQAQSIALDQSENDFKGDLTSIATAGNTFIADKNDLALGHVNSTGNLTVKVGGHLSETQGATVTVGGLTALQAKSVELDQASNDFNGALSAASSAGSTVLVDQNDLILGTVSSTGNLTINAQGGLSQIAGTSVSAQGASDVTAKSIDLSKSTNDFGGVLSAASTAGNTHIVDKNDLVLGNVSSAGDLSVDAKGALGQIAGTSVTAAGVTTVKAGSIALDQTGNDFKGELSSTSTAGNTSITDKNGLVLGSTSSAGDLNVVAGGQLTETQGAVVSVNGSSVLQAQSITLDQSGNDFHGALISNSTAGNTSITDKNDLTLGNTGSAGDLNVVAGGQLIETQGAVVTVNGASAVQAQSIALDQSGNDFKGTLTSNSTTGNASITDKSDLALGNTSSAGDLTVVAGGQLTEVQGAEVSVNGTTTVQAQSIALDQVGNDFKGALTSTSSAGGTHVVDKNDLTLANTNSAGELIVASGGQLSEAQNVTIVVNGASTLQAQSVTLNQAGNDFKGAVTAASTTGNARVDDQNDLLLGNISSAGGLTLHAQGSLSQVEGTAVSAKGDGNLGGQSINLTQANNDFGGTLSADSTAGNTHVVDKNDLVLGNVNSAADLTATAGGQLMEAKGAELSVAGNTQIQAQSVMLDQSGNDFKGALTAFSSAGNTTIVDQNDLILGNVSSTGDLSVNAKGGLSQMAGTAVSAQGASNVAAKSIDLSQANNDFGGALSVASAAGNTHIVDQNDLVLGNANSAGDLNVDAKGALSQLADTAITVAGKAIVQAQSVALNQSGNDFKGELTSTATEGNTSITDKNALVLGNVSSTGDLSVTAEGALSQVADTAITAAGTGTLQAQSIALDQSGNDFKGALTSNSTAGNASITDKSDLALGNTSSAGDLTVVAGGQLTEVQGAEVSVNGTTTVQAQSIALDQVGNDFKGALTSTSNAGGTHVVDKNDLTLGNASSAADLTLQAQGNITQGDGTNVKVQGVASVTGQNVDLSNTDNDFNDGLSLNAKADSTVHDQNDLLIRGATVGQNLTIQANKLSQTDGIAVGQATHIQAQSVDLSNLSNQWGTSEALKTAGDVKLAGQHVIFGSTQVGGNLLVSADQVAQTRAIGVDGTTQIQASTGNVDLHLANQLQGALTLTGDQVLVRNTLPTHVAYLNSKGGKLESDGVLYLEGNVFQGGGDFTFMTHATPAALSKSQIKGIQIPELDAYSDKSAVDPFSGVSDLSISSPGIEQTSGVIQTNAAAKTHFESTGNASIILNRDNQMNGLFTALSGEQYGSKYVYSYVKGASLVSVNNLAQLSTADQGVEADMVAIRADGLTTSGDSVLRARLPYNDLLVGASQSYPGLLLSIPVDSANRVNSNGVYEFGAQQTGGSLSGAIHVEVGNPDLPGFGGFSTVLPFQGAVVAPDQLVFLRGPKVNRLYSFYYDGAGNVTRIPVSYNGYIVLSPQESAALTSSQGSVNLARQEQQQSVVRTENVSGQVINGVIMEVGTGRPATEGTGGIAKPATCGSTSADQGC